MQRIALLCLLLALTAACAPLTPAPTATFTPAPTETLAPTKTFAPTATPVSLQEIFKDNPLFTSVGKEAIEYFSVENEKTYLAVTGPTGVIDQIEVDPDSAGVIVDAYGHTLQVEDTGSEKPLTIHGFGENASRVYSYIPETTITLNDKGETKTFPAHWAEVQKPEYTFDQLHNKDGSWNIERLTEQINNPLRFTVDQVQNGELARSVLLSGYMQPVPDDVKFTGNSLWHGPGEQLGAGTDLLHSGTQHIPFFAVVNVGGIDIGVRPVSTWNPKDQENPDRRQQLILNLGIGTDYLDEQNNKVYLDFAFLPNRYPNIIVEGKEIGINGHKELEWLPRESRQALEGLPGNDPVDIQFLGGTIKVDVPEIGTNSKPSSGWDYPNLWQWNYNEPLPKAVQELIWLFYF